MMGFNGSIQAFLYMHVVVFTSCCNPSYIPTSPVCHPSTHPSPCSFPAGSWVPQVRMDTGTQVFLFLIDLTSNSIL